MKLPGQQETCYVLTSRYAISMYDGALLLRCLISYRQQPCSVVVVYTDIAATCRAEPDLLIVGIRP